MENIAEQFRNSPMEDFIKGKIKEEIAVGKKKYNCELCQDTGTKIERYEESEFAGIKIKVPVFSNKKCICRIKADWERQVANSGLGHRVKRDTFDNFIADNPELTRNKKLAYYWAKNLPTNVLLLAGNSGTGKTHLASAVAGELMKTHGIIPKLALYNEIVDSAKGTYIDERKANELIYQHVEPKCLLIDDFLKAKFSDHDHNVLFRIINERCDKGKLTIVTTEVLSDDISKNKDLVGIYSRLIHGTQISTDKGHDNTFNLTFKNSPNRRIETNKEARVDILAEIFEATKNIN